MYYELVLSLVTLYGAHQLVILYKYIIIQMIMWYSIFIVYCIKCLPVGSPALLPVLESGYYDLIWEKCADLPSPLYATSVALHDNKVYTMAGTAPDDDTLDYVYVYDINSNQWDRLPPPGQYLGSLKIINS